ncbi:MAG: site-2 protease family protein [Sulfolobales archaeon]
MSDTSVLEIILYILLIELLLYLISMSRSGREFLSKIGLEVSVFTILIKKRGGLDLLDRIRGGRKSILLFRAGVIVMFVSIVLFYATVYLIGVNYVITFINSFLNPSTERLGPPPVAPIIPGITITGVDIVYLLIAIGISVAFHELGHAIASKTHDVPLKSYGAGIFLIMPLAFVEVDDERMMSDKRVATRILSAGVLFNMILFLISLAIILSILWISPLLGVIQGAVIASVEPDSPAYRAGIRPGLLITSVNGSTIYTLDNFLPYRMLISSPETLYLNITGVYPNGSVLRTIVYKPSNATRIGVVFDGVYIPIVGFFTGALIIPTSSSYVRLWLLEDLLRLMVWMMIINISLAVVNAAPLYITDGGKILSLYLSKRASNIIQMITVVGFAMIFTVSLLFYL